MKFVKKKRCNLRRVDRKNSKNLPLQHTHTHICIHTHTHIYIYICTVNVHEQVIPFFILDFILFRNFYKIQHLYFWHSISPHVCDLKPEVQL